MDLLCKFETQIVLRFTTLVSIVSETATILLIWGGQHEKQPYFKGQTALISNMSDTEGLSEK